MTSILPKIKQRCQRRRVGNGCSADEDLPLVKIRPDVYYENHDKQDAPPKKSAYPTAYLSLIKKQTNGNRAKNLGKPVDEVVQGPRSDIEYGRIEIGKFCEIN
jgi:hypothetical protein